MDRKVGTLGNARARGARSAPIAALEIADPVDEQPVDVSRFAAALRRAGWLIALIVVPLTGAVLVLSLLLPPTYSTTARLVLEERGNALESADAETMTRRLATIQTLLTSRDILTRAARSLPGESADTLEDKVSATVDDNASIIDVKAQDGDAAGAAAIADGVAKTYLAQQREQERRGVAEARMDLQLALERLREEDGSSVEIRAIRERLSELSVSEAVAGDELRLAQAARLPDAPSSPKPLQNTLFAFFAATFMAVLAVLAREALAPRVSGIAELARLTGLTPLVVLPGKRGRRAQSEAAEAHQALAASLRLQLADSQRLVMVTSAHRGDGRSSVALGLAQALADGGVPTLLMAADLRRPTLHETLGVPQAPGLTDVLSALERDGGESAADVMRTAVRAPAHAARGRLRVLPAGSALQHPAALFSSHALGELCEALEQSRYRFVIVEGPPLIGPIDGQLLARWVDALLVVCRPDRLSPNDATELAELLTQVEAPALGAVVLGGGRASYALNALPPARTAAVVS